MHMHEIGHAALAGSAGAVALTTLHETVRRLSVHAPRMDVVAMRGIERIAKSVGRKPPSRRVLHPISLAGDLITNSAYYALVALGRSRHAPMRGVLLGLLAGAGALVIPPRIGLGIPPHRDRRSNQLMTMAWYLVGGVVAGIVFRRFARRSSPAR